MTIMVPDLLAAVRNVAQGHFDWCNPAEHDYETPEHEAQLCKASTTVRFPNLGVRGDDVSSFAVELAGSRSDVAHGVPVPLASVGFNGEITGWDMESWKLIPLAMALLSAEARSRGDVTMERAYLDAANDAIDAHVIEAEHAGAEPEYVVARPAQHWSQGPFSYVQGGDPDGPLIPWGESESAQQAEPGVRVIVRDRHSYDHIEDDLVEEGASTEAESKYLDEQMLVLNGRFAGHHGIVDEVDMADADTPLRIRIDDVEGEPIEWLGLNDVEFAGSAR